MTFETLLKVKITKQESEEIADIKCMLQSVCDTQPTCSRCPFLKNDTCGKVIFCDMVRDWEVEQ